MSGNKNKPTSILAPPISVISNEKNIKKKIKTLTEDILERVF